MTGAPTTSAPDPAAAAASVPDPAASGSVPDTDADTPGSAPDAARERERKARERKARKASSDEAPPGLTVLMVLFFGWETLSDDNAVWMRILAALLLIAGVTELVRIVRRRRRARR
ncbi:hypothetical protein [Streptomyces sp. NPDC002185]|uniref:hypothetical protein n=1 Tax=Streptomyces sp. NPDC002185 TaxID=3364636 RepID=UPI0036825F82